MVRDGMAEKVKNSEYGHPAFIVGKGKNPSLDNDSDWRMVNDIGEINDWTKSLALPLPRIDDVIDRVAKSRFFTALDAAAGFWQIP